LTRPLRILLVEDSEEDAELVVRKMRRGGFDVAFERVDSAGTMAAALAGPFDLIISDSSMPVCNASGAPALCTTIGEPHEGRAATPSPDTRSSGDRRIRMASFG